MRAPSLARSKPAKRLSMSPVWSKNSTSWRTAKRICCMVSPSLLWLRFSPMRRAQSWVICSTASKSTAARVVAFQLVVTGLGTGHQVHRLLDSSWAARALKRSRARKPDRLLLSRNGCTAPPAGRQHGGVPAVVGDEGQPQGGDQDMVDLVFGVEGAGAGDDIIPAGQRLGADLFQQESGRPRPYSSRKTTVGRPKPGWCRCNRPVLGSDGRQEADLFAARPAFPGQEPGAQPLDIAAHLFKVGAAGFGPRLSSSRLPAEAM